MAETQIFALRLLDVSKRITEKYKGMSGRHSAATTILLSHGVPIETVSRILGHTNIKTTQIYTRITNQKINRDMETLSHKLEGMERSICDAI
jgi:site-specific recombinase XerD